ncbi:class I SAM-dependent methyltransferase [Chloroflexota bacterium]
MKIEKLIYSFFGNNLIIGHHIRKQLKLLKDIIPPYFQHRKMDDLGCGDGKVTILLNEIFLPERLRGFDINPGLVNRARTKGIAADVIDLDGHMPTSELAVLWGVLHHLPDIKGCLKRLKENYPLIFIREPVRNSYFRLLELGHTMKKEKIEQMVNKHLPDSETIYCGNSVFVFYVSPDYYVKSPKVD